MRPSAESLDAAAPLLESAIEAVETLQRALQAPLSGADREAAAQALLGLRQDLDAFRKLVAYGAAYHAAWARVLSGMAGYDSSGEARLPATPRLNLHA